jgi:hypothetical protein
VAAGQPPGGPSSTRARSPATSSSLASSAPSADPSSAMTSESPVSIPCRFSTHTLFLSVVRSFCWMQLQFPLPEIDHAVLCTNAILVCDDSLRSFFYISELYSFSVRICTPFRRVQTISILTSKEAEHCEMK